MKSIFKFIPAALAIVALASCSNEDLVGGSNVAKNVKGTMEVTVEGGESTRAAFYYDGESDRPFFVAGDGIRAYDEAMQKYDLFEFDEEADAFTTETQYVADGTHRYAIFPTDKVSYSGWVPGGEAGSMQALVNIPDELDEYTSSSQGITVNNKYAAFKAYLPMWGDITSDADSKLKANLNFLSSYLVLSLTNASAGEVFAIEITSMKEGTVANTAYDNTKAPSGANTVKQWVANPDKPLCGFFDAEMKTNGQLKKSTQDAIKASYGPTLTIDINPANLAYNSDIYVPIVPETYDSIQIKVYDSANTTGKVIAHKNWSGIKDDVTGATANTVVAANQKPFVRAKGKTVKIGYAATKTLGSVGSPAIPYDITELLGQYASASGEVELTVTLPGGLATQNQDATSRHTITIPSNLKNNIIVNLNGDVDATAKALTIAGGTAGKTVTFNFSDGTTAEFEGNLVLNTTSAIVLTGSMGDIDSDGDNTDDAASTLTVTKTGGLTLGTADDAFTAATAVVGEAATVTVNANDITVANAEIDALTTFVNPTIDGVDTEITTLTLSKNVTAVTLKNGMIGTIQNNNSTDKLVGNVLVSSEGVSAVTEVKETGITSGKHITFTSKLTVAASTITTGWTTEALAGIKAASGEIFTAAQLAALKGNNTAGYKLMTDITAFEKDFATIAALSKVFDGNNKTITGLNVPLFGALSANVKNLTLANSNIKIVNSQAGIGALAKTATAAADITKVCVTNVYLGQEETKATNNTINLGGLVGIFVPTADAHLKFTDCYVTGDIKGYGQMGGFIGSVDATTAVPTISILNTAGLATKTSVTFANTFYSSLSRDMMMGTVGNFIGCITNATNKPVITFGGDADKTYLNSFGAFATDNIDAESLRFSKNYTVKTDGETKDKGYVGMPNHEIGYSEPLGQTDTKIDLYLYKGTKESKPVKDYINKLQ